ncbi:hypothetical protein Tco_1145573 [Tanacetum coccineum]
MALSWARVPVRNLTAVRADTQLELLHCGESGRRVPAGGRTGTALSGPSRASNSQLKNSALNVTVKKFNQARVNGGSNYDSLKVAKCLVI